MKSPIILLIVLFSFTLSCSSRSELQGTSAPMPQAQADAVAKEQQRSDVYAGQTKKVSLSEADKAETIAEAADRKIIRNADITLEVASTTEAQHSVTSIAEARGGFVVTSEALQRKSTDPAQRTTDFKLVVRVPANQFGVALDEIKKLADNILEEKANGQDVTEEFIDLEARIKTQKALEIQFLEIMRQTKNIEDALQVQRQIAEVRTVIEQLEGRKRFLENRSSLATITVNVQAPKPVIATTPTGFSHSLREAVSESVELGSGMILFFVRFLIVGLPVFLFLGVPTALLLRYLIRRGKRMRLAQALAMSAPE